MNLIKFFKQGSLSYSQTGEDLIIDFWLNKKQGFYIDVGSNDPILLNNTYLFYKKGWSGINIEPNPYLIEKIKNKRCRDKNLNIGISKKNTDLPFYIFSPSTMSTFSKEEMLIYNRKYTLTETMKIKCLSLKNVIETYAADADIDILSVDVEGSDLEVLESNDWKQYRPKFVIVETVEHQPILKNTSIYVNFFIKHEYYLFADTFINSIFVSAEQVANMGIYYEKH